MTDWRETFTVEGAEVMVEQVDGVYTVRATCPDYRVEVVMRDLFFLSVAEVLSAASSAAWAAVHPAPGAGEG